jgi:hypothetical protein
MDMLQAGAHASRDAVSALTAIVLAQVLFNSFGHA